MGNTRKPGTIEAEAKKQLRRRLDLVPDGTKLPTGPKLAASLGYGEVTISRALQSLADEGDVVRVIGGRRAGYYKPGEDVPPSLRDVETAVRDLVGALADGDRLPPIAELAGDLGVSRPTVRNGLRALRREGVVVSRRGTGGGWFKPYAGEPAGAAAAADPDV